MDHVGYLIDGFLLFCFVKGLHGIDDNRDKQVQDGKAGQKNERHENDPRPRIDKHHRADDTHRPALQRHHLEQGVHRVADGAEPVGKRRAEQFGGDDGEHIEDQQQQYADRADTGNGMQQRGNDPAQPRHRRDQPQHAQHAERPQNRQRIVGRRQGDCDDDEIENAPRVAEKPRAMRIEPQHDLDTENHDNDLIEDMNLRADRCHNRRRRLHPQRKRVDDDQSHDRFLEDRVFDQPADPTAYAGIRGYFRSRIVSRQRSSPVAGCAFYRKRSTNDNGRQRHSRFSCSLHTG